MNLKDYINHLEKKQRKSTVRAKRLRNLSFIFCVIAMVIFAAIYFNTIFGIPEPISDYLLVTFFAKFSAAKLMSLLIDHYGDTRELSLFLSIYWSTPVLLILTLVFYSIASFLRIAERLQKYQVGLLGAESVRNSLIRNAEAINSRHKKKFKKCVLPWRSYLYIMPLIPKWHKVPEMQWFTHSAIRKQEKVILYALSNFKNTLLAAIENERDLQQFLKPIELMRDFFFSIAMRKDAILKDDWSSDNPVTSKPEIEILAQFARLTRPLIIQSKRTALPDKKHQILKFTSRVIEVFSSPHVRKAVTVSGTAALVMFLGVFLFKIEAKQAFLTWFAVTFGSLTISVGVTSFKLAKEERDSPNEERET